MPKTLSELTGQAISDVKCSAFESRGFSGSNNHMLAVETNQGLGSRYIIKQVSLAWDWIMRASNDQKAREVALMEWGLVDRLPPEIRHPLVACFRDGPVAGFLMHDISPTIMPNHEQPISKEDNAFLLDAMAAQHMAFWQMPFPADDPLGLIPLNQFIQMLSHRTARREIDGNPESVAYIVAQRYLIGWDLVPELLASDVADIVYQLTEDPQPLCHAMERYPKTLLHGDWWVNNMGLVRSPKHQLFLLDWQAATQSVPAVDLARYLTKQHYCLPISRESAIESYRQSLAQRLGNRYDDGWWQPQLDLGLLTDFVRCICFLAWNAAHCPNRTVATSAKQDVDWLAEHARTAIRWL
ncbi:MAG: phosphotransferase [Chloroflexota bacterium]